MLVQTEQNKRNAGKARKGAKAGRAQYDPRASRETAQRMAQSRAPLLSAYERGLLAEAADRQAESEREARRRGRPRKIEMEKAA